jgi:hypothetical protein
MRFTLLVSLGMVAACGNLPGFPDGGIDGPRAQPDASAACNLMACSAIADQCCPDACNAGNDPDCTSECGNGVIETGETCDPLASCPTACPTIGCQLRTLDKPGTCGAACVNSGQVTDCLAVADGCCPSGCNNNNDADCAAVCDNGTLEPGEHCDPLAQCPTACPQLGCGLYTLFDPGTCRAVCALTGTQSACVNGDGCCPGGCNANNDSDCQPACNNNVVEAGETCDPLGSCPTACAALGCQLYDLANPGTCQAQCVAGAQQTACQNGDNCCPTGCDATNDDDCQPGCGNNVVEPGETCDPLASCPVSCAPMGCQLYDVANAGTCQAQCVAGAVQTACQNGDGCCPTNCNAISDTDCPATCGNGIVEPGESCDGNCPRCAEATSCYTSTGAAETCDLVCHVPVTTCGINGDSCCAFDGNGCGSSNDRECAGPKWAYAMVTQVDLSQGCRTIQVYGIASGGSYLFTSCSPPGNNPPAGDPLVSKIADPVGNIVYPYNNDDALDPTALPNLAGWNCKNAVGESRMYSAPANPGGFIVIGSPTHIDVTVCPYGASTGVIPFFVWFNAPIQPHLG